MTTIYTKASEISQAVSDRIAAIRTGTGAETDIGARVFRGRRNVDESLVPCAVVIEGNDTVQQQQAGRTSATASLTQRYVVAAYVPCDSDNPNDAAHAAIRDIKRAIFGGGSTFGGRVLKVAYRGRDIGPRADGAPVVFVTVDFDVDYVEDLTNP